MGAKNELEAALILLQDGHPAITETLKENVIVKIQNAIGFCNMAQTAMDGMAALIGRMHGDSVGGIIAEHKAWSRGWWWGFLTSTVVCGLLFWIFLGIAGGGA